MALTVEPPELRDDAGAGGAALGARTMTTGRAGGADCEAISKAGAARGCCCTGCGGGGGGAARGASYSAAYLQR